MILCEDGYEVVVYFIILLSYSTIFHMFCRDMFRQDRDLKCAIRDSELLDVGWDTKRSGVGESLIC